MIAQITADRLSADWGGWGCTCRRLDAAQPANADHPAPRIKTRSRKRDPGFACKQIPSSPHGKPERASLSGQMQNRMKKKACKADLFYCFFWCPEEDSNLHTLRHTDLNRARLPIPPSGPNTSYNFSSFALHPTRCSLYSVMRRCQPLFVGLMCNDQNARELIDTFPTSQR